MRRRRTRPRLPVVDLFLVRCDRGFSRLIRRRSKKSSNLRVTGLCGGNSPVTGEFPAQMACNAEYVPIWWRHHEYGKDELTSLTTHGAGCVNWCFFCDNGLFLVGLAMNWAVFVLLTCAKLKMFCDFYHYLQLIKVFGLQVYRWHL